MRNHRRLLEACFGADRAGVYYTTISTRLRPEEIAYIVRDCGASLLVVSDGSTRPAAPVAAAAAELMALLHDRAACARLRGLGSCGGRGAGHADRRPRAGPGHAVLVGHHRAPEGREVADAGRAGGRAHDARRLLSPLFDYGRHSRYLSPAPLYHAAPLRHSMTVIKLGGCVFVMEHFDAERALSLVEAHRITHSQWVPTMFVRMLKLPTRRGAVRPVVDAGCGPRRRAMPGRGQAPHARLVGADHPRVLRRHREQRLLLDHAAGVAGASGIGRAGHAGRAAHLRRQR